MGFNVVAIILLSVCCLGWVQIVAGVPKSGFAETFLSLPNHGTRSARMSLGTQVGTGECAHIGRSCWMERDRADNPSKLTYVPCCQHLECQGFSAVELKNGLGQAHSTSDKQFSGICGVSLNNGGGDLEAYKAYLGEL